MSGEVTEVQRTTRGQCLPMQHCGSAAAAPETVLGWDHLFCLEHRCQGGDRLGTLLLLSWACHHGNKVSSLL